MEGLQIMVPNLEDPYRDLVTAFLSREFPANLDSKGTLLENLTAAIIATGKIRFGPAPSPESLVLIRQAIRTAIENGDPIPILCPWGSKKPRNQISIDMAEVGGLKTLACLNKRVKAHYPPGLQINLQVEDVGGYYLFANEGEAAWQASDRYVTDLLKLVKILGLDFIKVKLESWVVRRSEYLRVAEEVRPVLLRYLLETDEKGLENCQELGSWAALAAIGWQGTIPVEQREYYRQLYRRLYPSESTEEHTGRLATYLACALTRYKLGARGDEKSWNGNFIQLNFIPQVPGAPTALASRHVYYRTLPADMAKTHIPPWRARGFLEVRGNEIKTKIASWHDELDLLPGTVTFERDGQGVEVQVDKLIVE